MKKLLSNNSFVLIFTFAAGGIAMFFIEDNYSDNSENHDKHKLSMWMIGVAATMWLYASITEKIRRM